MGVFGRLIPGSKQADHPQNLKEPRARMEPPDIGARFVGPLGLAVASVPPRLRGSRERLTRRHEALALYLIARREADRLSMAAIARRVGCARSALFQLLRRYVYPYPDVPRPLPLLDWRRLGLVVLDRSTGALVCTLCGGVCRDQQRDSLFLHMLVHFLVRRTPQEFWGESPFKRYTRIYDGLGAEAILYLDRHLSREEDGRYDFYFDVRNEPVWTDITPIVPWGQPSPKRGKARARRMAASLGRSSERRQPA